MLLFIDNPVGLIIVFVLVLLLFGPQKVPEVANSLGRALRELKRATSDFTNALNTDDHHTPHEPPRYDQYEAAHYDHSATAISAGSASAYETNSSEHWQPDAPEQKAQAAITSAPVVVGDHAAAAFAGAEETDHGFHTMPVLTTHGGDDYGIAETPKDTSSVTVRPADSTVPRQTS